MYTRWYLDVIFKYIGQLIYYSSYTLLIPVFLSLIFKEPFAVTVAYFVIFLTVFFIGLILYKTISLNKRPFVNLNFVHYLAIICGFWILFSFFSALPLIVVGGFTILDSVFETMSMLTTTGLSVLPILPTLASLIFWRSILAWVGGIGLILLAYFGVLNSHSSFNKLMRAEGRELIRPNVKNTIKHLWMIYSILTIFGIILLIVFGMNLFNSINYTMAAISTTGLQIGINDALLLENPFIQLSLVLILMIGATSFLTHYFALRKKSIVEYFKDNQFIAFLSLVGISTFVFLVTIGSKHSWTKLLFLSVSAISGGGFEIFGAEEMVVIPAISLLVITVLMFVGGSTNSTSGGIKMHRLVLLFKSIYWKIKEIILPENAHFPRKYNDEQYDDEKISSIYFFVFIYFIFILIGTFVLVAYNNPLQESFFEVISAQSNVGLSSGVTTSALPVIPKVMLIINMWIGRLEIIPFLGLVGLLFQKKIYL